jgi:nucleoside-diphosphate-sugar epimerase
MSNRQNRVLVTGATGHVGGQVVAQLLDAGVPVRVLARTPQNVNLPAEVEVVAGDLTRPETLRREGGGSKPSTRTLERYAAATGSRLRISFDPEAVRS